MPRLSEGEATGRIRLASSFFAAIDAFRALRPEVVEREAKDEVRRAICWAAAEHTKWFWRGVHYVKPGPPT